jgi:hypothetical protein
MPENIVEDGVGREEGRVPGWREKILESKEPIIQAKTFDEALALFADQMNTRYFGWDTVANLGRAALIHNEQEVAQRALLMAAEMRVSEGDYGANPTRVMQNGFDQVVSAVSSLRG